MRQLIAVLPDAIGNLKSNYSLDSDFDALYQRFQTQNDVVKDLTEKMKHNLHKLDEIYEVLTIIIIRFYSSFKDYKNFKDESNVDYLIDELIKFERLVTVSRLK